jgi:hypothetical protein
LLSPGGALYDELSLFVAFLAGGAEQQRVAGPAQGVVVVPLAVDAGVAAAAHLAHRTPGTDVSILKNVYFRQKIGEKMTLQVFKFAGFQPKFFNIKPFFISPVALRHRN